jgi:hypothetical protein
MSKSIIPWIKKNKGWILFLRMKTKIMNPPIRIDNVRIKFGNKLNAKRNMLKQTNIKMRKNRKMLRWMRKKGRLNENPRRLRLELRTTRATYSLNKYRITRERATEIMFEAKAKNGAFLNFSIEKYFWA